MLADKRSKQEKLKQEKITSFKIIFPQQRVA